MELEWIAVESKRITHYAYDAQTSTIYVIFTDGVQWSYFECGPEVWEQFRLAPSPGGFIREVLDQHPHGPA
jgi:hypothetical protein